MSERKLREALESVKTVISGLKEISEGMGDDATLYKSVIKQIDDALKSETEPSAQHIIDEIKEITQEEIDEIHKVIHHITERDREGIQGEEVNEFYGR